MTTETLILLFAALATSTLSGIMGMGGGVILLTIMAQYYPPTTLIPLHGLVQLASNLSRSAVNRESIDWKISRHFVLGVVIGAFIGRFIVIKIPNDVYTIFLACFIMLVTWMPSIKLKWKRAAQAKFMVLGAVASFLSLIVGATGPLLAPFFLREGLKKEQIVATKAFCQFIIHSAKILVFVSLGFVLNEHLNLILGMVVLVFLGSWLGKQLLHKISDKYFTIFFKSLVTILALRMIAKVYF